MKSFFILFPVFFFFNDTATTEIYTLSLHDALPIFLASPHADELDPKLRERTRVDAADEPRSDDRRPHEAARNIRVRTSMSSRACSGGVRHSLPSVTHAWKWRSSRAKLSS